MFIWINPTFENHPYPLVAISNIAQAAALLYSIVPNFLRKFIKDEDIPAYWNKLF